MRSRTIVGLSLAPFALFLIACGAGGADGDSATSGAGAAPATQAATKKPAGPASSITSDGTYLVGKDIRSGQWKAQVPADSLGCYWERMKNTDGDFDSILANETVDAGGQAVVTIKATDKAFKTDGCGTWKRVG